MMSSDEIREWRELERGKLIQLEDRDEKRQTILLINILTAVLGDDE